MTKIAFIAPDKHLFLQGKKIIAEMNLQDKVTLHLGLLNRGVRIAHSLDPQEVDVIISRGGTAKIIIDSGVRIPVVEIAVSGQDLAQVFHESKKITGLHRPKVALLGFDNMVYDIEILSAILGIDLTILPLEKAEDLDTKVEEVSHTDADIVVGGMKTLRLAARKGLKALLIRSGDYSVRSALSEAQKVSLGRKFEKEQAQKFKALADYSLEGIISVDALQNITLCNPAAEKLLDRTAGSLMGKNIDAVFSGIDLEPCLKQNKTVIGQTLPCGKAWITLNMAPVIVDGSATGAIITFQDITHIQEIEARIRNDVLSKRFIASYRLSDIIGSSPEIGETRRMAGEIAKVDATVLIAGESGTGKELFAQGIHNSSRRRHGPFIAINCAALPANLLESELFGYVEGAFTGATKKGKPGLFEMAHKGTIFLDEISEMDRYGQSRLLRVLQERQVMRLGDDKYIPVDVRIIAATNKNLTNLIQSGQFRQDLFYRLKVLTLHLPALRDRTGDIPVLARHFISLFNRRHSRRLELDTSAVSFLARHDWPGNVRELMYFLERLVIVANEQLLTAGSLPKYWDHDTPVRQTDASPPQGRSSPGSGEKETITAALTECQGNISRTAQLLGMDRSTLYRKLRTHRIEVKKIY